MGVIFLDKKRETAFNELQKLIKKIPQNIDPQKEKDEYFEEKYGPLNYQSEKDPKKHSK